MKDILKQQKACEERRCLRILQEGVNDKLSDADSVQERFLKCEKDCSVGTKEVVEMHKKHAEVTRLTYTKNIQRCMQIHANGASSKEALVSDDGDDQKADWAGLAHCIEHNTDKVDRRFFGYYNNIKMKTVNKYSIDFL